MRTERYSFQIDRNGEQLLLDNDNDPYQVDPIALEELPKADRNFILSELGIWLKGSNDPWYRERKFKDLIQYPS